MIIAERGALLKAQILSTAPKIDKFRQKLVDFSLLFIKKYKNHKKSWQYPVDKAKIYDILWQTNESERVRLFALF